MHSPALLLRSGLTENRHIGAHLRVHPASLIYGLFPPTHPHTPIRPHLGPIISTIITETANLSTGPFNSYGSRIETGYMLPLVGLGQLPWLSAVQFKNYLARYENMVGIFSLARDGRRGVGTASTHFDSDDMVDASGYMPENDGGRVMVGPSTGDPIFSYILHPCDRDSLVEGLLVAAEVLLTAGATEIVSSIHRVPPYIHDSSSGIHAPAFREWQRTLRGMASKPGYVQFTTAHQMGTNRMCGVGWEDADAAGVGVGPDGNMWRAGGVVDPEGRVYGVEGLWVVDASVLPGASGVNPMLSVMGVADVIGERMRSEERRVGKECVP